MSRFEWWQVHNNSSGREPWESSSQILDVGGQASSDKGRKGAKDGEWLYFIDTFAEVRARTDDIETRTDTNDDKSEGHLGLTIAT